jgi:hypothetical protein
MKNEKLNKLENQLSKITGENVEITIRGEKSFTFSFETKNETAANKIIRFFKSACKSIISNYDIECDQTCIYMEV